MSTKQKQKNRNTTFYASELAFFDMHMRVFKKPRCDVIIISSNHT